MEIFNIDFDYFEQGCSKELLKTGELQEVISCGMS